MQVRAQRRTRLIPQRHHPGPATRAGEPDSRAAPVPDAEIRDVEPSRFGDPGARAVEDLEQCAISQGQRDPPGGCPGRRLGRTDESLHLGRGQRLRRSGRC